MHARKSRYLPALVLSAICAVLPLPSVAVGADGPSKQPDYCDTERLEVRQIALDAPGMNHTRAFFAVLNNGPAACVLRAGPGFVWSNNQIQPSTPVGSEQDAAALSKLNPQRPDRPDLDSSKSYVLPPVPPDGQMALKDIVGFAIWNSGAADTTWFSSLSTQLPDANGKAMTQVFRSAYQGYATVPIMRTSFVLQPFLSWSALEWEDCSPDGGSDTLVGEDAKGDDIPQRTIDVRQMLRCG